MSISCHFKFAQVEMSEIEGIRIKRTVESFVVDDAYEYTFWKLTLDEMVFDFRTLARTYRECFHFCTSYGKFCRTSGNTLIEIVGCGWQQLYVTNRKYGIVYFQNDRHV